MAGIHTSLGYRPLQRWSRGHGDYTDTLPMRCSSILGRENNQSYQECRCQHGRVLNCGAHEQQQPHHPVLRQIEEIQIGLNELSSRRIPGPDGVDKVNRLADRLQVLTNGVQRSLDGGGAVPAQLMAALNALQREQCSLANIIRLASVSLVPREGEEDEDGPVREESLTNVSVKRSSENVINSLEWESAVVPVKQAVYEMSAGVTKDATMAAVRAEIERRVIQQLTGKSVSESKPVEAVKELRVLETVVHRAEHAENQLRRIETKLGRTIPLEVHESLVHTLQETLREAQANITELTTELADKERILKTVKNDFQKEQGDFLNKVACLRGEIAERTTNMEELQATINEVMEEFSHGLQEIQKRTEVLTAELEAKENLLAQLKKEWKAETKSLRKKLAKSQKQVKELEQARTIDQAELAVAKSKIVLLEDELSGVRQDYEDAEAKRKIQQQESFAKMKTLITEMVKISRARSEKEADVAELMNTAVPKRETELVVVKSGEKIPTEERMRKLQNFFSLMKDLLAKGYKNN